MSKKLNLLALPKQRDFMACFVAPPGHVLVQGDVKALEPHVLTHFSQDPVLMSVYGKQAWQGHDIYLIAGMKVPGYKELILPNYTLQDFTTEGVKAARSAVNAAAASGQIVGEGRGTLKDSYLGWIYGLGAPTLSNKLEISLAEARTILLGMDRQFAGKTMLHDRLTREWAKNGGYIIGGRGRPICCDFGSKKDLVNRLVQTTGHDVLTRINWHINQERKRLKVEMRPYIPDFHDEGIWAAREHEVERAKEVINYGFDRVNDELNWTVTIRHGGLNHGPDLTLRVDD